MKLIYRGQSYEYNPPTVEYTESEVGGKYRGLDWRFRNLKQQPVLHPRANLTYRGVSYQVHPATEDSSVKPRTQPSIQEKARNLMLGHTRSIKKRQQSLLGRSAAEIGLDETAGYWNRIQGKVHPSFRQTLDRRQVTLS